MKKIFIDTDVGNDIDDIFALSYLFARDDAEILGVTTVRGDTQYRAYYADVIARAAKRPVPIRRGAPLMLIGTSSGGVIEKYKAFADDNAHGEDFGNGAHDAVELMYEAISKNPGEVTLIAIGPLTNVALLFAIHPDAPALLDELVIMGGAYFENPRCTWDIRVEYNIKCDPHAAHIVFGADVGRISVYGVELTWDYQLPRLVATELLESADWTEPQSRFARNVYSGDPIWFHDPLACALTFEDMGVYEVGDIDIEIADKACIGKSTFAPREGGRCRVCTGLTVSKEEFYEHYRRTLAAYSPK